MAVATPPKAAPSRAAVQTALAEKSLRHFVRQAWHLVEPGRELQHAFYIDAICDHLQAVAEGDIKRLVITLPPGFLKSTIVSVLFPAWLWVRDPSYRFLTTSHDSDLAMRDSVRSRRVITSEWFQQRWGDRFAMTTDQNVKTRYENDRTGHRISLGVNSAVTGKRGDLIMCDDPHDAEDAHSPTTIDETVRWWNETISSRLNDQKTGAKIVIQQRIASNDLAGVVASQGYEHLNLPLEYEPEHRMPPTVIGWEDPRTEPGESLHPERWGPQEIADAKTEYGSRVYAAQFQQRPVKSEGGILKREWFGVYARPENHYYQIIQSWDTAFKTNETSDYSACLTLGVGLYGLDVLDVYRARLEFPDLERALQDQHLTWSTRYPGTPLTVLIEDKGSGQSLIQSTRRLPHRNINVIPIPAFRPNEKTKRVHDISPAVESHRVRLPVEAHWLDEAVTEWTSYPFVTHDDVTDALSMAVARADGIGETASVAVDTSAFAPVQPTTSFRRLRR